MARPKSRIQKKLEVGAPLATPPGGHYTQTFQLEGGTEECQIKRMNLSMGTKGGMASVYLALADEPFLTLTDFSDNRILTGFVVGVDGSQAVNHTTTVRVPRGWYLGILVKNRDSVNVDVAFAALVNYYVIS